MSVLIALWAEHCCTLSPTLFPVSSILSYHIKVKKRKNTPKNKWRREWRPYESLSHDMLLNKILATLLLLISFTQDWWKQDKMGSAFFSEGRYDASFVQKWKKSFTHTLFTQTPLIDWHQPQTSSNTFSWTTHLYAEQVTPQFWHSFK